MHQSPKYKTALLSGIALLLSPCAFAKSYSYSLIAGPSAVVTSVSGVNDAGLAVGSYTIVVNNNAEQLGYTWLKGRLKKLAPPGSVNSECNAVNNSGTIAGAYAKADNVIHGFTYANGVFTTMDVPGATGTVLTEINDAGDIVGQAAVNGTVQNFTYIKGKYVFVANLAASTSTGVDLHGASTGYYFDQNSTEQAYIAQGKTYAQIVIPGVGSVYSTEADGISRSGTVIGTYVLAADFSFHGFLDTKGTITTVNLPGVANVGLYGINNHGVVIGRANVQPSDPGYAFSMEKGKVSMISAGSGTTYVYKVNDTGIVAGEYVSGSTTEGFIAIPQ